MPWHCEFRTRVVFCALLDKSTFCNLWFWQVLPVAMADLPGVWSRQAMHWLHAFNQMAKHKDAKGYIQQHCPSSAQDPYVPNPCGPKPKLFLAP